MNLFFLAYIPENSINGIITNSPPSELPFSSPGNSFSLPCGHLVAVEFFAKKPYAIAKKTTQIKNLKIILRMNVLKRANLESIDG
jgi:hypothetical protein